MTDTSDKCVTSATHKKWLCERKARHPGFLSQRSFDWMELIIAQLAYKNLDFTHD